MHYRLSGDYAAIDHTIRRFAQRHLASACVIELPLNAHQPELRQHVLALARHFAMPLVELPASQPLALAWSEALMALSWHLAAPICLLGPSIQRIDYLAALRAWLALPVSDVLRIGRRQMQCASAEAYAQKYWRKAVKNEDYVMHNGWCFDRTVAYSEVVRLGFSWPLPWQALRAVDEVARVWTVVDSLVPPLLYDRLLAGGMRKLCRPPPTLSEVPPPMP